MIPLDRAMFIGAPDKGELEGLAREGVKVFLAAYGTGGKPKQG